MAGTVYQSLCDKAKKVLTSESELRDCGEAGVWASTIRTRYLNHAKAHHTIYSLLRQYLNTLEMLAQRLADNMTTTNIDEALHKLRVGLHTTPQAIGMTVHDIDKRRHDHEVETNY